MKVSTAIARIKAAGHDISDEYSQDRCIEFLNTAIQQVGALLIQAKYPPMVKETTVRNGDTLSEAGISNYMQAAGNYPLKVTGNAIYITDDALDSVKLRYFATPPFVEYPTDDIPFDHHAIDEVVVKLAICLALNENEYDISQDSNLLGALQQAIAGGLTQM